MHTMGIFDFTIGHDVVSAFVQAREFKLILLALDTKGKHTLPERSEHFICCHEYFEQFSG